MLNALTHKLSICILLSIAFCTVLRVYQVCSGDDLYWRADSTAFYTAARLLKTEVPNKLYDFELQKKIQLEILNGKSFEGGLLPYNYPPHFAMLSLLGGNFDLKSFYQGSVVVQVLLIALIITLFVKIKVCPERQIFLCICLILAQDSLNLAICLGTLSVLMTLALLLFYYAVKNKCNLLLAISVLLLTFKPQFLAIVLPIICTLPYRQIAFSTLGIIVVPILSSFFFPLTIWTDFLVILSQSSSAWDEFGIYPDKMINLKAMLALIFGVEYKLQITLTTKLLFITSVATTIAMSFLVKSKKLQLFAEIEILFSLYILFYMIFAIHLNPQDSLLLCLPAMLIYSQFTGRRKIILGSFIYLAVVGLNVMRGTAHDWIPYFTFLLSFSLLTLSAILIKTKLNLLSKT